MNSEFGAKCIAVITMMLGVCAIILPRWFGTTAIVLLAVVMVASGIIALLHSYSVGRLGDPLGVLGPWVQVIAGLVVLFWPDLTLWLVAVLLGGGLILAGIIGLSALRSSRVVNPSVLQKAGYWVIIVLGALLIVMGATGSALLLGIVLGIALIASGLQQWRSERA